MSLVNIEPESLSNLKDKVIVVLGVTTGIRAAVIRQATEPNIKATPLKSDIEAKVVWGDVAEPPTPDARFVRTDATSYGSVLDLFKTALEAHWQDNHTVYSAGVTGSGEDGLLFDTVTASPSPIDEEPSTRVVDAGRRREPEERALFHARRDVPRARELAAAKGEGSVRGREGETDDDDTSILLVGSSNGVAGFAGPVQYCASKHGPLGLFRGAWGTLSATGGAVGIKMNVVVPSVTTSRADGEAYYVAGSKTYEIEKRLEALRAQWLGADVYRVLVKAQDVFVDLGVNHKYRR
ncbi:hypothetical protein DL770_003870 [Monosporascus sp. CRB-9-2]|nr:hypothetical protein DL770_003870 [Monosporascus sp. CRB-9-2]